MARRYAALRPKGKVFAQPLGLAKVVLVVSATFERAVADEGRRDVRVADGAARNGRRRGDVSIEQRGLNGKRIGVVFETEGLFIRRQHRLRVNFDSEQVADGVRVFGAIETVQAGGTAGVHASCGGAVDFRFQPGGDSIVGCVIRAPDAYRWHGSAVQLHDDFFPGLR